MKNLVILNESTIDFSSRCHPDLDVENCSFEPVSDTITCVMSDETKSFLELQRMNKNGKTELLCSFDNPSPGSALISFRQFDDERTFAFVFDNGDIIVGHGGDEIDQFSLEIVGLMDADILAAEWSPDDEILVVVTVNFKMLLISRSFEPIHSVDFSDLDLKGYNANVSVGWGKSETQFRGKGFKALEREREAHKNIGANFQQSETACDPTISREEGGELSSTDDGSVHIAWRDDCDVFAVSSISDSNDAQGAPRRVIRLFLRDGRLEAISQAVDGLAPCLTWRCQGTLLTATRTRYSDHQKEISEVIFFERNGLRHGEFDIDHSQILELSWSCDGEVLAVLYVDKVQFWTTKNYHWSLKQECIFGSSLLQPSIMFHPEKPLIAMLTSKRQGVRILSLGVTLDNGASTRGSDLGLVSVIDGRKVKLSPLAIANVPPPMCLINVEHPEPIKSVSVNQTLKLLVALSGNLNFYLTENIPLDEAKDLISDKWDLKPNFIDDDSIPKQICLLDSGSLLVLSDDPLSSAIYVFDVRSTTLCCKYKLPSRSFLLRMLADGKTAVTEQFDGSVLQVNEHGYEIVARFPQFCAHIEAITTSLKSLLIIGLSDTGKLYYNERILAKGVTSFKLTDQFLCVTTAQSKLCFIHIETICSADLSYISSIDLEDERLRQIERGSTLVTVAPSRYAVILQAPRGNLETIYPRIMVLTAVRDFIKDKEYLKAFTACRSHRIDLDILCDYDLKAFEDNIDVFVQQVRKVEYLDLFISCLRQYDVTKDKYLDTAKQVDNDPNDLTKPERKTLSENEALLVESNKINKICNMLLKELSKPSYGGSYLQVRISALACQQPPNDEGALNLIGEIVDKDLLDDAITHICYLRDPAKLYDKALGLYNVHLALQVAQKSQMDPKEYLPFLQKLHREDEKRRKFLIDDFLQRYDSAIVWLHDLGEDFKSELNDYVIAHSLYKNALELYGRDEKRRDEILYLYARHLKNISEYGEAGKAHEYLGEREAALENYILGKQWKEALYIARDVKSDEEFKAIAEMLSTQLEEDRLYHDAATIEMHFLKNNLRAARLFCKAYDFNSALLVAQSCLSSSIEEVIKSEMIEAFGIILELLADCNGQLVSQLNRLREIRRKKSEDPSSFYGKLSIGTDVPDDVSIAASELSATPSFFTRYTDKSNETAKTGASRRTLKNRKREERKRAKGRKGTIYEEEYLVRSVGRLIDRLNSSMLDSEQLVNALTRKKLWVEAHQIQASWKNLIFFLEENIHEIFDISETDRERLDEDGNIYLAPAIPVPELRSYPFMKILDY